MLTFKPAAGSIVSYHSKYGSKRAVYLITGYDYVKSCADFYPMDTYKGSNIAQVLDLDTMEKTSIIIKFDKWRTFEREYNEYLTVIG